MAFFDAAERRLRREHRERAWLAWHAGLLSHEFKTFPTLDKLLGPSDPRGAPPRQSWQTQMAMASAWDQAINRRKGAARHG